MKTTSVFSSSGLQVFFGDSELASCTAAMLQVSGVFDFRSQLGLQESLRFRLQSLLRSAGSRSLALHLESSARSRHCPQRGTVF